MFIHNVSPRLPDEKFFDFPDQYGACLVVQTYHGLAGAQDFYVVQDIMDLKKLVQAARLRSRIEIVPASDAFYCATSLNPYNKFYDCVYIPDEQGLCRPGCY